MHLFMNMRFFRTFDMDLKYVDNKSKHKSELRTFQQQQVKDNDSKFWICCESYIFPPSCHVLEINIGTTAKDSRD